jgi:DNA-binding CsgD family transcriptional regulator
MTIPRYTDKQLDKELDTISPAKGSAKDTILRLRRAGETYKSIADTVSLNPNKVREICLAADLGGGCIQRQSASTDPAEIIALREVGFSYTAIAKKLGVRSDIVSRVCHDAGLYPGSPLFRSKSRHPLKPEILALRREGYVYKAIADKLDLVVSLVHKVCTGEGDLPVGQGTRGRKDEKKRNLQKERVGEIRKLREEGKTLIAIGDMFGISRERVRQVCEGIPAPDIRKRCNCHECGKEFIVHGKPHSSSKYCSRRCGKISHKRSKQKPDTKWSNHGYVELICVGCSKTFTRTNRMYALAEYYRKKKGLHPNGPKYCTQECYLDTRQKSALKRRHDRYLEEGYKPFDATTE